MNNSLKKEDQILAFTYSKVMENPLKNSYLAGHLPMAKSIIKAMDASVEILNNDHNIKTNNFILSGASKRGWAIWLASLEDARVSAIIPIVIDILNVPKTIAHICSIYKNGCPEALRDYKNEGITKKINTIQFQDLMKIEDPFSYLSADYNEKYRQRLSIPKYIINSSGDDFFTPDSSQFYFKKLPGNDNYIRYLPNSMHYISGNPISDKLANQKKVNDSISSYYFFNINNTQLPKIKYDLLNNKINVISSIKPKKVIIWYANNNQRDFRCINSYSYFNLFLKKIFSYFTNNLCDTSFKSKDIAFTCIEEHKCNINIDLIDNINKWQASFAELHYKIGGKNFIITTEVKIKSKKQ